MKLITLASLVISLVVINVLFRIGLARLKKRNFIIDYVKRFLPIMELTGWTVFSVWLLNILLVNSNYITHFRIALFIVFLSFLSWYFLRDLLSGIVIKTRFNLVKGQKIKYGIATGDIRKVGVLALKIKDDNGTDLIIPYSSIQQQDISLNYRESGESESKFTIELENIRDEKKAVDKIEELIENSVWNHHSFKPQVRVKAHTNKKILFEIICLPINNQGVAKLKLIILQNLG